MPFSALPAVIGEALAARGYETATDVQTAILSPDTLGRDLLVSAQTGSGKTVAYGLAMASTLLGDQEKMGFAREPQALIIAPTRELAMQVQRELTWLYGPAGARVASCVGGMNVREEQRALRNGAHIVVGTPGRLRDHLERGSLVTSSLKVVVLDEADEMLDLGFREDIEEILDVTPPERRTLLFSATIPKPIAILAKTYQRDAMRIETTSAGKAHADIDYRAIAVAPADIEHAVVNVLRLYEANGAMVFCATRENVRRLHASLVERGFAAVALSGELSQNERTHALQALRDKRARVCVATDVAARGIDLPDLGLVVHAELPIDPETLQHRSGRTGRAGRKGTCVLIVPYPRRRRAEGMLRAANVKASWVAAPTAEDIRQKDQARLIETITPGEAAEDDLIVARQLLEKHSAEDIAAAFVRTQRQNLPEPEEMFAGGPEERSPRPDGPRAGFEDTVWFRMNIGRSANADPRWLLPLLCRRGHITKTDVGAIRIGDRETLFQIPRAVADRFAESLRRTAGADDDVLIEPAGDAPAGAGRPPPAERGRARPPLGRAEALQRSADRAALMEAIPGIHILVDGDACPVKEEVYRVARRYALPVRVVTNAHMRVPAEPLIERVIVSSGFDAADDWIAERAHRLSIVITADILLADRCIKAGAVVIGNTGRPFDAGSIGNAVAMRALTADLRAMDQIGGGPPPFSKADRSRFLEALDQAVVRLKRRPA